jgi:hypothetical protein
MHRPDQELAPTPDAPPRPDDEPTVGVATVDGVEVRYGDSPGRLRAVLTFRVGMADETLPRRGITHLVEHLALARCPLRRDGYNGCVTDVTTSFMAVGEPGEIRDFLASTTAALAALPLDRLATEVRILRTEDQGRGRSMASIASAYRFGSRTHGLSDTGDIGLPAIDEAAVLDWARRYFVRGNATLWLSAAPPEDLDLSALPDGPHHLPPAVEPLPQQLPAWGPGLQGAVGVSLLGTRTVAFATAVGVLEQRLHRRLRQDEGRSYQVGTSYERWTAEDCEVLVFADAQPEDIDAVRTALAEELHRLGDRGATEEELEERHRDRAKDESGTDASAREAMWRADELLLTGVDPDGSEIRDEYAALTPAAVARAIELASATAIWIVPSGHGVEDRRVLRLPDPTDRPAEGRRYKRARGVLRALAADELRVGDEEVGVATGDGWRRTIRFSEVEALQRWDDGARTVWAADGSLLFLHPSGWRDGAAAMDAIDAGVPRDLWITPGEDSGFDPADEQKPRRRLLPTRA